MNIDGILASMTPATYQNLRQAVETGKWPDGRPLDDNQKAVCLQAVMLYQSKVEQSEEHMTIGADGDIVHKSKRELKAELNDNTQTIVTFKEDDF